MRVARSTPQTSSPDERLQLLASLAARSGASRAEREALDLAARVAEGRFLVACVGQFKRGKSTLLNALLGDPLLPTGVVPVTSAITIVRKGPRGARILFEGGREQAIQVEDIPQYASEQYNPSNRKRVQAVEVFSQSFILDHGLCLVDTPGLGSSTEASDSITREFLPQVDVALIVTGADPPLSGDEVALAEGIAAHARHVLVVLNKSDRLTEPERDQGAAFAASLLSTRLHRPIGRVYQVSAQERLVTGEATRDWSDLSGALAHLARTAGHGLVHAAEHRAVDRLGRAILDEIDERRDALRRPIADSQARLGRLETQIAQAQRALADLGILLASEQARLAKLFRKRQEEFLGPAQEAARRALFDRLRVLSVPLSHLRNTGFEVARDVSGEIVERFRAELEPEGERLYAEAMERFVRLANDFLDRAAGEPGLDTLPRTIGTEAGFRVSSSVFYTDLRYTTVSSLGWFWDSLRTRRGALRAVFRLTAGYLDRLVESNSSRIASDLVERLSSSREKLEEEISSMLNEISDRAGRALSDAERKRSSGQRAVEAELSRLEDLRNEAASLIASTVEEAI
ncbi:MAG TPA: dynamin family protein [Anaeromyxobacteraceae bacterium]|nr:dynamin family protein [Anaeromyxobacteraceae bacterium]